MRHVPDGERHQRGGARATARAQSKSHVRHSCVETAVDRRVSATRGGRPGAESPEAPEDRHEGAVSYDLLRLRALLLELFTVCASCGRTMATGGPPASCCRRPHRSQLSAQGHAASCFRTYTRDPPHASETTVEGHQQVPGDTECPGFAALASEGAAHSAERLEVPAHSLY